MNNFLPQEKGIGIDLFFSFVTRDRFLLVGDL